MGVYEGRGQLSKSYNQLQAHWQDVKMGWSDSASDYFEKKILEPLAADLHVASGAMEHMAQVLNKVKRDCQ